jgi:hypothetical protein
MAAGNETCNNVQTQDAQPVPYVLPLYLGIMSLQCALDMVTSISIFLNYITTYKQNINLKKILFLYHSGLHACTPTHTKGMEIVGDKCMV